MATAPGHAGHAVNNTKLMTARFPMTATLTDSRGGTLELTI